MSRVRVTIPEESHLVAEFRQEGLPGIAVLNESLVGFDARIAFRWHLSIMIQFEDLIEQGMPSQTDRNLVDPFGDALDALLKEDLAKPNALFLGRITWNATRELLYRVHDPEPTDRVLRRVISMEEYPRPFDYRMDDDPDWKLASWHLGVCSGK